MHEAFLLTAFTFLQSMKTASEYLSSPLLFVAVGLDVTTMPVRLRTSGELSDPFISNAS